MICRHWYTDEHWRHGIGTHPKLLLEGMVETGEVLHLLREGHPGERGYTEAPQPQLTLPRAEDRADQEGGAKGSGLGEERSRKE